MTTTSTRERPVIELAARTRLLRGGIASIVAGVVFGAMLQSMGMLPMIGALYGVPTAAAGWIAHIFHSIVFGLVFVVLLGVPAIAGYTRGIGTGIAAGALYGIAVWLTAAAVVMPLWMSALGMAAPAIPNLDVMSLLGHAVFGIVLGGVYAALVRSRPVTNDENDETTTV